MKATKLFLTAALAGGCYFSHAQQNSQLATAPPLAGSLAGEITSGFSEPNFSGMGFRTVVNGTMAERMRISPDGRVGINTGTNPVVAQLDVNGTMRAGISIQNGVVLPVMINTTTNELHRGTSTLQLKDNINNLSFNRDSFLMLMPRDFIWKPALGGSPSSGFIAEEVASVMPQLAVFGPKEFFNTDGYPVLDSLGNPTKDTSQIVPVYVDYNIITTYMFAILKDYRDSIAELRHQLENIDNKVNSCCFYDSSHSSGIINQNENAISNNGINIKYYKNLKNPNFIFAESITLEHTYSPGETVGSGVSTLYLLKLHFSGEKYAAINYDSSKLKLFNMDYSVFKVIDLPFSMNSVAVLVYISENLFDTDSTIEYLVMFGGWNPSVKIYNEDGSILWEETECNPGCEIAWVTGAGDPDKSKAAPIINTEMGAKMIIHCNVPQQMPYYGGGTVKVYGLPGSLIGSGLELYNNEVPQQFLIYPNPSGNSATVEYALPQGESKGEIVITNLMGAVVKKVAVGSGSGSMQLDNTQLPAGTYFYQLQTAKGVVGTKKMIVVR